MKLNLLFIALPLLLFPYKADCQQQLDNNYKIYLKWNGTSKNTNTPIVLEEEREKEEVVYSINGNDATRTVTYYEKVDSNFSFRELDPNVNYSSLIVDIEQDKDKLILLLKGDELNAFKAFNKNKKRRLALDITHGTKVTKVSTKISALTVPLKVYLSTKSDSLQHRTNNISTDLNIGFSIGRSHDTYIFQKGKTPELISTKSIIGYFGVNKLSLNEKNTDSKNSADNIISFSLGGGLQIGYSNLNASLLAGIDLPLSEFGKNWVFRYQPWLGIGVGFFLY